MLGAFIRICLENMVFFKLCVEISWMQWITSTLSTQLNFYIIHIKVQLCGRCRYSFQSLNSCFVKIGQNIGNVREDLCLLSCWQWSVTQQYTRKLVACPWQHLIFACRFVTKGTSIACVVTINGRCENVSVVGVMGGRGWSSVALRPLMIKPGCQCE